MIKVRAERSRDACRGRKGNLCLSKAKILHSELTGNAERERSFDLVPRPCFLDLASKMSWFEGEKKKEKEGEDENKKKEERKRENQMRTIEAAICATIEAAIGRAVLGAFI
jgi:hypothetical protein